MRLPVFVKSYLLVAMVCFASVSQATNFYVDASTTLSTQNGTLANPWKTLSQVSSNMNLFQPGDFVLFKRGETFTGNLYPTRGGTASAPLTFGAYGTGNKPKFTGTGSTIGYLFYVYNKSYITFRDLWITDPSIDNNDRSIDAKIQRAFTFDQSATNCKIVACDIHLVGVAGYFIGGFNTMDSCDVGNLRMVVDTDQGYQPGNDDDYGANPLVISSANNTITHNYFHDCWATSFDYGFDGGAIEFYGSGTNNNFIGYNTIYDCIGLSEITGNSSNNTYAYNKLINNGSLFYFQSGSTYSGYNLYNNVIIENAAPRVPESRMIGGSISTGAVVMKNNVFQLSNGVDVASNTTAIVHEDNIYKLTNNSVVGFTLHVSELSTAAAIFASTTASLPIAWNYSPAAASPAIDFGQNVGLARDFAGNPVPAVPNSGILESAVVNTALSAASSGAPITCNAGTTTVTVSGSGGTSPYTGTGSFTVIAGTYTYTITDAAGATATTSITVGQPAVISVSTLAGTIATFGGTTSVTVIASGGTGILTYKLNSGSYVSSNIFATVAAGTHTVTVKDANGCTTSKTFTINQPAAPAPLAASASAGVITCNNGTATVTVTATGGVTPYVGTGSFTVTAGTYNYTVTDANAGSVTTSITVTQPTAISVTTNNGTIAVYGGTTSVSVNATGGTGTFTYKLNSGTYQSSSVFTGVAAGNHTVTVKDANGCTSTKSFALTQPAAPATLVATSSAGFIACNGGSTVVTVLATGGVSPYTGAGTFNVSAGTYNYTVTDASGNTTSTSITVVQPSAISVSVATGTIAVFGGTTDVTVTSNGGTGSHTYKLDGSVYQSSNTFSLVSAGSHTITVKDANGCTSVRNFNITQPAAPSPLIVTSAAGTINCNGSTTTVTVSATGGTAPYTGTGSFTVNAGTFNYIVTDINGTTATTSITVTQPSAITASVSTGNITIFGGTTGVTVTATGGTAPYTYKLNSGTFQSSNTFATVAAGSHTITIKDANGCSIVNSFTLTEPAQNTFIATAVATAISCNGAISTITVSAAGGTAPYTGTGYFTGYAGTYSYTVTDANGATATTTIVITEPASIVLNISAGTISLAGGRTTVNASASGGAAPYSFMLDNNVYQASGAFTSVASGTHTVTVKDGNGCTTYRTFVIAEPGNTNFKISLISRVNVDCRGNNSGAIEVLARGGRAPYTYQLNSGRFTTNNKFTNLTAGVYRVTAQDANGNLVSLVAYVFDGRRRCATNGLNGGKLNLTSYPNPTSDRFSLEIKSESEEDVIVQVMNLYGRKVFEGRGSVAKKYVFGQDFPTGTYFIKVLQGEKQMSQKIIKL